MKFGRSLRSRFWRGSLQEEVDNELDFHVEMRTREFVAAGMDPAAARDAAVRRFGDLSSVNQTCRQIGRRRDQDMRRTEYLSELMQDVTFACRQLLKAPGFSIIAILTLALGIGATSAIFSAVHAVVLRPLPVPDPDRLVAVYEFFRNNNGSMSAGNYVDAVAQSTSFSHTTAILYSSFNLGDSADAERIIGARTTAGFFGVFATPPALGRVYSVEEDQPGREQVVVLSHRLWTRRFGSDRQVVGRQIRMSGRPVRSHRRHAAIVRLHESDGRIVGADRMDRRAQGDARRAHVSDLRTAEGGCAGRAGGVGAGGVRRRSPQALPQGRLGAELHSRSR